ncbi:MAG: HAD-IB family hydrolase [Dermatophilaceae bacterium]|nr:HAD-IB family hydrolase [Intrasporangiaceae bacterium]
MSLTDAALRQRLDEVYSGPMGPEIGAFFDFDGTLIHGFSAIDFYLDRIRRGKVGPIEGLQTIALALRGITTEEDFERFVGVGLGTFKGRTEEEILAVGDRVFRGTIASRVFPEAWQLVEAHQRMGHTVVLASSATRFQIQPAADVLGIRHVLYTPLGIDEDGNLTGKPGGKTLWRAGKAAAVREFAELHDISLEDSYGYSNGDEDIPFLQQVGHPAATTSEPILRAHAVEHGWPVLDFRPRGVPGISDLLRSGAAIGGLTTGMFTGAAFGLLNRSRQRAVDTMAVLSSELSLGLAGIQVEVQGEEHLWSHRPAVFIFNHQSQLDLALSSYLLRHGFTGVAKEELKRDPIVGLPFRFAGVAFVDRKGGKDPRKALAPAVKKLHDGISIVIAPEGTRSLTPTLGPFKTGAFFLAKEAGVPIVPIVIRNAGELMWRDSYTLKSGTIQVVVQPPIDVSGWKSDEMRERVAEVRQMYADTLARWPQGPATVSGVAVEAHAPGEVDVANLTRGDLELKPLATQPPKPRVKKATAKKATAKKATAKKSAAKRATTKKSAAKSAPARRTTTSAAKKTAAKKTAARKTAARKASAPKGSSLAIAPRTAPSGTRRSRERHSIVELVSPEVSG